MKKKIAILILGWAVLLPAVAGCAVMWLWNLLMPDLTGCAAIGFWQAVGMFLLGQVLSGGIIFGLLLPLMGVHMVSHRRNHAALKRWRSLTEEQRQEIFRKRMARFGGCDE